jgi:hypothetical protein
MLIGSAGGGVSAAGHRFVMTARAATMARGTARPIDVAEEVVECSWADFAWITSRIQGAPVAAGVFADFR